MLYAVGVIEIRSIAKGIEACDDALKSANIRLVSAHPSCPGKYEMILTGPLSDVQTSLERVRDTYGRYVIDAVLMGRIDETVVRALLGGQNAKAAGALGVIETKSAMSPRRWRPAPFTPRIRGCSPAARSWRRPIRICGSICKTRGGICPLFPDGIRISGQSVMDWPLLT